MRAYYLILLLLLITSCQGVYEDIIFETDGTVTVKRDVLFEESRFKIPGEFDSIRSRLPADSVKKILQMLRDRTVAMYTMPASRINSLPGLLSSSTVGFDSGAFFHVLSTFHFNNLKSFDSLHKWMWYVHDTARLSYFLQLVRDPMKDSSKKDHAFFPYRMEGEKEKTSLSFSFPQIKKNDREVNAIDSGIVKIFRKDADLYIRVFSSRLTPPEKGSPLEVIPNGQQWHIPIDQLLDARFRKYESVVFTIKDSR